MSLRARLALLLLMLLAVPAVHAQDGPAQDGPARKGGEVHVPFNVSFWRGVSLGDALAGSDTTKRVVHYLSLNLPYGEADRLDGIAVGLLSSVYERSARGIMLSGFANVAGEDAAGFQVAGLANVAGERMRGLQLSTLANVAGEDGWGIQGAGLANVGGESFRGVQVAGLANVGGESLQGIQLAGLANVGGEEVGGLQGAVVANVAGESMWGIQTAGIANVAGEAMRGIQAAGLANVVGEDAVGIQAAGLANVTGKTLRGVQVGLINVAAESEGLQVGVVNAAGEQRGVPVGLYSRTEGVPVYLDVWTDETAALHVGLRTGSATVSNYVGIGTRPFADAPFRWDLMAGLGVERPIRGGTSWGLDLTAHLLLAEDFGDAGGLYRLRGLLLHDLSDRLAVFGGPALSVLVSDEPDGLAPYTLFEREGDTDVRGWLGAVAGVRVRVTSPWGGWRD